MREGKKNGCTLLRKLGEKLKGLRGPRRRFSRFSTVISNQISRKKPFEGGSTKKVEH